VPGMIPPVVAVVVIVVAATCRRMVVVIVKVKGRMMIRIWTQFLGPSLGPGQT